MEQGQHEQREHNGEAIASEPHFVLGDVLDLKNVASHTRKREAVQSYEQRSSWGELDFDVEFSGRGNSMGEDSTPANVCHRPIALEEAMLRMFDAEGEAEELADRLRCCHIDYQNVSAELNREKDKTNELSAAVKELEIDLVKAIEQRDKAIGEKYMLEVRMEKAAVGGAISLENGDKHPWSETHESGSLVDEMIAIKIHNANASFQLDSAKKKVRDATEENRSLMNQLCRFSFLW